MDLATRLKRAADRIAIDIAARDDLIREAAAAGMTRRAIAEHVGLSFQRVHQIIAAGD
jgi:uncharacterized phage protein gp47/JayE